MNVKELIDKLSELPEGAEVKHSSDISGIEEEINEVEYFIYKGVVYLS